ncbi:MAG TPA: porin [Rudaea sp.]|nr:porin [Rudaea sp.]
MNVRISNSNNHRSAPRRALLSGAILAGIAFAGFGVNAQAADDTSLTWNGITLYGTVDIGIAYQNHGAPLSQDFYPTLQYMIGSSNNKSITTVASSGLSQSKVGLRGVEPLNDVLSFVFNLESGFNPTSGKFADGPKSLINNNGVALANRKAAGDGSRAGQVFNGQAWGGFSSKDWGTLSIGRHVTLFGDSTTKYDPMNGSYAFSIIGYSGLTAGMGDTQDVRLDDSVKYTIKHDWFHAGALYQFGKSDGSPGEAWQLDAGFDYAGFSVDALWGQKKDAISAASLSAAQVATPGVPFDSLAATISDNEAWQIAASYTNGPWKASGGYEHITFSNPSLPVAAGFSGLGGYWIAFTNNTAFPHDKKLDVSWIGLKYNFSKDLDLTGAWYGYSQDAYGAVKCSDNRAGNCSGNEDVWSVRLDYRLTRRLDVYAGAAWSKVQDGLASGFLNTSATTLMTGFRFNF